MDYFEKTIEDLKLSGRFRLLRRIDSPQGRDFVMNGKRVLNFCSNDYLGLANDARIKQAAIDGINQWGYGSGASRLVCGNQSPHEALEEKIAEFKRTEAALVFTSGFAANAGIIPTLVGRHDAVISDRLNHASIVDGIVLSRAKHLRYEHNDIEDLERCLKSVGSGKKLIVTDTVFSMDGDVAPLEAIMRLANQYEALVMVDEAHALGVLGKDGAGLSSLLESKPAIQMGTLSKAAGCFGGFAAVSNTMRDYLINHARSFIYTTAMPASNALAAITALDLIKQAGDRREYVNQLAQSLREQLNKKGFNTLHSQTPIIPVVLGDDAVAIKVSQRLFEQGICVSAIRPPTVPEGSARLRITVTALHIQDDVDYLLNVLNKI